MGRRSQYTPEELRELILSATQRIVEDRGFAAVSAREIAREIGYAPGTLYNMFENLDEILLRVEARILLELDEHLARRMSGRKPTEAVKAFIAGYVEFAYKSPRLWELIQFHQPQLGKSAPDWYLDSIYAPVNRLEAALSAHNGTRDAEDAALNARQMWAAVHGILQLATTPKFGVMPLATATWMIENALAPIVSDETPESLGPKSALHASNGAKKERRIS